MDAYHSFYAKALAVKRVTTKGKSTSALTRLHGLLHWKPKPYSLWKTWPQATTFKTCKYQKKNRKLRPLGIPTMKDRAMQALYLMALDPIAETTGDSHSYRIPQTSLAHDAIEQCYIVLSRSVAPEWFLRGHQRMLRPYQPCVVNQQYPMDKEILRKWLECGYVFNGTLSLRKREPHKVA